MFTAATIKVQRPNGDIEEYAVSFGGGPIAENGDVKEQMHEWLQQYVAGELHHIPTIQKVQTFLLAAGYGFTNVIVVEVGPLQEVA